MGVPAVESHQSLAALTGTLLALSVIAVGLRFYSRFLQKTRVKWDDWVMIPCLIAVVGQFILTFVDIHDHLLGYPTPTNSKELAESAPKLSKTLIGSDFLYLAAYGFVKISALLFYHRIFCVQGRSVFKIIIYISIVVVFLWMLIFMILAAEQCGSHFSALWGSSAVRAKYCNAKYPFLLTAAASDFGLDVWVIGLPIPMIFSLQMNLARKLSVTGVFLLAIVGLAASIAKLIILAQITKAGASFKGDFRLVETKTDFFINLEAGLSCIAVNLPSLYFLTSKVRPESVLRSVRSMLSLDSLRSIGSQRSQRSQRRNTYPETAGKESQSGQSLSVSNLVPPEQAHTTETHAMSDLEVARSSLPDNVHVTKTISQSSERR